MASSKVMTASRSPPNPDLPRQPSSPPLNLHSDHNRSFGSMNMDDLFRNMYSDTDSFALESNGAGNGQGGAGAGGGGGSSAGNGGMRNGNGIKTVDEVWKDIIHGGARAGGGGSEEPAMTLEDFLTKAGVVNEDDVRVPEVVSMAPPPPAVSGFAMETAMINPATGVPAVQFGQAVCVQNGFGVDFGNGLAAVSGGGRGKRRAAVEEAPMDKATQQKQRRMIKNRESAARSRERKQAYTVELESLVTQLEEDNARLSKEQAELNKKRYKQLMENLIPVTEKRRPPRSLRRVHSMQW
ncbi:hypothetical protein CDL12_22297 [Handroanthus impetiginosus]|uniref:BZIP domain-containing protein n=1 Tax=Handroanthus impetiginosus TaxID=429701 RepID=A0A2G9GIN5_9LAMI|nr:hypothetical protein CDL12_22297 [Handroanthus impetiginosus]